MTKQYTMYDVGSSYLTSCGVEAPDGDCFENMTECCDELNRLLKENEQLKQQLINVDKLIDDKIKEYQKYDEYDTEKYYIGTQLLKELKKEIER